MLKTMYINVRAVYYFIALMVGAGVVVGIPFYMYYYFIIDRYNKNNSMYRSIIELVLFLVIYTPIEIIILITLGRWGAAISLVPFHIGMYIILNYFIALYAKISTETINMINEYPKERVHSYGVSGFEVMTISTILYMILELAFSMFTGC